MDRINIKLMTEAALETLRQNIEYYTESFNKNPTNSSWIESIVPENVFETKKYQIEDFELKVPTDFQDRKTDLENAIILYEHLHVLPGYVLSEPRFWMWVMFEKGYEASLKSMEKIDSTSFKHQWLFVDGMRRGLFFGVLSRLYFRVDLTVDPTNAEDPYYLTKYVMENPSRFREISWRTISNQKFVVKAMLKAEMRVNKELEFEEKGDYFSRLAKEICKLGSIKLIDAMDEKDVEDLIYERYYKIVSSDLERIKLEKYNKAIDYLGSNENKTIMKALEIFTELQDFMESKRMLEECEEKLKVQKKGGLFGFLKGKKK